MNIGMVFHRMAQPPPPPPTFRRTIPVTVSPRSGRFDLVFYCPKDYPQSRSRYPVVVNFHGGGFTLGNGTDDARWAEAVVRHVKAVVVSVEYRLAPEHPFPTAVEDGVDALLYLSENAGELNLDRAKIAVSGFSAGGNMTFTVPLRYEEELRRRHGSFGEGSSKAFGSHSSDPNERIEGELNEDQQPVAAIVAWYPSTDYTNTRAERKETIPVDKGLPAFFTNLFDASYLHPPHEVSVADPFLSPGVAPDEMLRGLPHDIIMYTCQWDELQAEGERFRDRLVTKLGKNVIYKMIKDVPHAWDKSPNPIHWDPKIDRLYRDACIELIRVFENGTHDCRKAHKP